MGQACRVWTDFQGLRRLPRLGGWGGHSVRTKGGRRSWELTGGWICPRRGENGGWGEKGVLLVALEGLG